MSQISIIILLIFGLLLTCLGGSIIFSYKTLEWIYRSKLWERPEKDGLFGPKGGEKFDRFVSGGRFLGVGLVIVLGCLWILLFL